MAKRCLLLGEGRDGCDLEEELWAEMLWLYVEEDVAEFVGKCFGRMVDLAASAIQKTEGRYPMRVEELPWRADIKAAIDQSEYLIVGPGPTIRIKKFLTYAQERQTKGKIKVITILDD